MSELTSPSTSDSDVPPIPRRAPGGPRGRPVSRRGARGRGRGRGRSTVATRTAATDSVAPSSSRASSLSPERSGSPELAAPPSPELGIPSAEAFDRADRAKSSSLSEQSSKSPSPGPRPPPQPPLDKTTSRLRCASISSALTATTEKGNDEETNGNSDTEDSSSVPVTRRRPPPAKRTTGIASSDESSSEVDQEEAEGGSKRRGPAPRGRGRPRGAKRTFPNARGSRAAASAAVANAPRESPTPTPTQNGTSTTPRATRATVTLPPGYIEGVKGARWPKTRRTGSGNSALTEPEGEEDETPALPPKRAVKGKGKAKEVEPEEVALETEQEEPTEQVKEEEQPVEEAKPEIVVEPPSAMDVDDASSIAPSREATMPLEPEPTPTPTPEPVAVSTPTKKGKKGKGKEKETVKEKASSELPERPASKRRKLDKHDLEKQAARSAARVVFLEQLEKESDLIEEGKHPLIERTLRQLTEEKDRRLKNLAKVLEQKEVEYEKCRDAGTEQAWRQWADEKEILRTTLYFENHNSLKQLINEEKTFPFLRDHPLLVNNHGLPPTPFYRAPILESDTQFIPRTIIHAGHYLEAPPRNPALDHSIWSLDSTDIEADMAMIRDFDSAFAPPPQPPAPLPMYGYGAPYYYDQNPYQHGAPPGAYAPQYYNPAPTHHLGQPAPSNQQQPREDYPNSSNYGHHQSYSQPPPPASFESTYGSAPKSQATTSKSNPTHQHSQSTSSHTSSHSHAHSHFHQHPSSSGTAAHSNASGSASHASAPLTTTKPTTSQVPEPKPAASRPASAFTLPSSSSYGPLGSLSNPKPLHTTANSTSSTSHHSRTSYSTASGVNGGTAAAGGGGGATPSTSTALTGGMTAASRAPSAWNGSWNGSAGAKAPAPTKFARMPDPFAWGVSAPGGAATGYGAAYGSSLSDQKTSNAAKATGAGGATAVPAPGANGATGAATNRAYSYWG